MPRRPWRRPHEPEPVSYDALEWEACPATPRDRALAKQAPPPLMWSTRDKTLTKVAPPHTSYASTKADNVDDLDAAGRINGRRIRLKALWGVFPRWFESTQAHRFRLKSGGSRDSARIGRLGLGINLVASDRDSRQLYTRVHAELRIGVAQMGADGVMGKVELTGDLAVGHSAGDELDDGEF